MSTRSMIAIEDNETGAVRAIYCHFDGYLTGVGQTLLDHWADRKKVEALIDLGSISTLGEVLGEKHNFDWHTELPFDGDPDLYENDPRDKMVCAFGRDRGVTDCEAKSFPNVEAYHAATTDSWAEYAYLFRQGVWFVCKIGGGAGPFLVSANDPNGTKEPVWKNLAGALTFEGDPSRSYAVSNGPST